MDTKQLKALLKVLRDNGVSNYKTADIELSLVPEALLPQGEARPQQQVEIPSENPYANFPSGELSPDQLMYYSAGGSPDEDPENDN
jgi:hypothetical protein